jgi:tetraacyldisaccharide 4'-kinase
LLREPPKALRRADVVVLTRCDQIAAAVRDSLRRAIARVAPGVPVVEAVHRPVNLCNANREIAPLERLRGRPIAAFCGIGNPEAFRRTLLDLGAPLQAFRTFPDHHSYSCRDVDDLRNWARQLATDCRVVTTQKDLVKLHLTDLNNRELWALRVLLQVEVGRDMLDLKLEEASKARTQSNCRLQSAECRIQSAICNLQS